MGLAPRKRNVVRHRVVGFTPVVRGEDDVGVVGDADTVQRVEDASHALVHLLGHRRVCRIGVRLIPEHAEIFLDQVIAVLRQGFRPSPNRRVHSVVRHLHEERPAGLRLLLDEGDRIIRHLVAAFRVGLGRKPLVVARQPVMRIVAVTLRRAPAHVPLAEMAGGVVGVVLLEQLGDGRLLVRDVAHGEGHDHRLVEVHGVVEHLNVGDPVLVGHHVDDVGGPQPRRRLAGLDAHPRGRTVRRRRIGVGELHALGGESLEARRPVQVARRIRHAVVHLHGGAGPALVVREYQHDVLRGRLVGKEQGRDGSQWKFASVHWEMLRRDGESISRKVVKVASGGW